MNYAYLAHLAQDIATVNRNADIPELIRHADTMMEEADLLEHAVLHERGQSIAHVESWDDNNPKDDDGTWLAEVLGLLNKPMEKHHHVENRQVEEQGEYKPIWVHFQNSTFKSAFWHAVCQSLELQGDELVDTIITKIFRTTSRTNLYQFVRILAAQFIGCSRISAKYQSNPPLFDLGPEKEITDAVLGTEQYLRSREVLQTLLMNGTVENAANELYRDIHLARGTVSSIAQWSRLEREKLPVMLSKSQYDELNFQILQHFIPGVSRGVTTTIATAMWPLDYQLATTHTRKRRLPSSSKAPTTMSPLAFVRWVLDIALSWCESTEETEVLDFIAGLHKILLQPEGTTNDSTPPPPKQPGLAIASRPQVCQPHGTPEISCTDDPSVIAEQRLIKADQHLQQALENMGILGGVGRKQSMGRRRKTKVQFSENDTDVDTPSTGFSELANAEPHILDRAVIPEPEKNFITPKELEDSIMPIHLLAHSNLQATATKSEKRQTQAPTPEKRVIQSRTSASERISSPLLPTRPKQGAQLPSTQAPLLHFLRKIAQAEQRRQKTLRMQRDSFSLSNEMAPPVLHTSSPCFVPFDSNSDQRRLLDSLVSDRSLELVFAGRPLFPVKERPITRAKAAPCVVWEASPISLETQKPATTPSKSRQFYLAAQKFSERSTFQVDADSVEPTLPNYEQLHSVFQRFARSYQEEPTTDTRLPQLRDFLPHLAASIQEHCEARASQSSLNSPWAGPRRRRLEPSVG